MAGVRVRLWPNIHFFDAGMFFTHEKLTFTNAERIIKYSIAKGSEGGWPMLSWSIWKHMACEKLKLEEDLAWSYFEVFDALQGMRLKTCKRDFNFVNTFCTRNHKLAFLIGPTLLSHFSRKPYQISTNGFLLCVAK